MDPAAGSPARSRTAAGLVAFAPALAAALFGLAWFLANGGLAALPPGRTGWVLRWPDPAEHFLGWAFFRNEPWRLPLGAIPGYAVPIGSTVAVTDSIPLLALVLRPISGGLPADFQYQGAWLALAFALQGWFGARIGLALRADRVGQFLCGALLALAPVALWRLGHEALTAHFLLLALIALVIRSPLSAAPSRTLFGAGAFALLAAAVHPSLAAMALGLAFATAGGLALAGRIGLPTALAAVALYAAADALVFWLLGYGGTPLSAHGFGTYPADLLALVNPSGWSHVLPSSIVPGGDGYGYLGLGVLALCVPAVLSRFSWNRDLVPWRRIAPLLFVSAAFALFAFSNRLFLAGRLLATFDLPASVLAAVAPFRASGRFIWPLHYLVAAGAIAGTFSLLRGRPWLTRLALAAAVAAQLIDLGFDRVRVHFQPVDPPSLQGWEAARGHFRTLALFPPRLQNSDREGCGGSFGPREFGLAYRAYRLGLGVNSGYLSRLDLERASAACNQARADLAARRLRSDALYVPDRESLPLFLAAGAVCGRIGREAVCVARESSGSLKHQLGDGRAGAKASR